MDLFDPADSATYQVPWRPDPRPVDGVLNGTYAYLAVGELWRSRARERPGSHAHGQLPRVPVPGRARDRDPPERDALTSAGVALRPGHGLGNAIMGR